jgi:Primase C terminal 1 (PriCT-1)
VAAISEGYQGLGFVFSKSDPFTGIDLDRCLTADGQVKPWAQGIIERFADTYMEISPSGLGVKIWARGSCFSRRAASGRRSHPGPRGFVPVAPGRKTRGKIGHSNHNQTDAFHLGASTIRSVSIAGTLRARRVCDEAIQACLAAIAEHQCERPMDPDHIKRIVKSTRKWGAR